MPDHTTDSAQRPLAAAAYAALAELERVNELAAAAPGLAERMTVAEAAAVRYELYRVVVARLTGAAPPPGESAQSVEAVEAMAQTADAIDDARRRTRTADWWEGLAAASLCAPLSDDLFAALIGPDDGGEADPAGRSWADRRLGDAAREDPALAARLALWSRRLVGEAIVLAREFGGEQYPRLAARLAADHARRLAALGFAE